MQYKMYPDNAVPRIYWNLKIKSPVESNGKYPWLKQKKYLIEKEENWSNGKNECIADEGFSWQASNRSRFSDLEYDKGESEGLNGSRKSENEREFTITEDEIQQEDDATEYSPISGVLFLKDSHLWNLLF